MKSPEENVPDRKPRTTARLVSIVGLMLAFFIVMLVGLMTRLLWQTTLVGFVLCGIGWWLLSKPSNITEKLLSNIYNCGAYCLILGLAFEPYEGGIKKDCATMSYYFVSAGLAVFMLIAFTIVTDIFKKRRWLQLLIDNGQNPMIAYIGRFTLVLPLLALTRINPLMDRLFVGPWPGFVHSVITTLIIALVVSVFTKRKIFWRT
jgi:predicted acyltransferase